MNVLGSYILGGPGLSIELHLEELKVKHKQQLDELELQHQASLERRLLQNSLLTTNTDWIPKTNPKGSKPKICKQHSSRPADRTAGPVSVRPKKLLPQDSWKVKEEADLAECQMQFRVTPVPEHVSRALYEDLIQERERLKREGHEQRRDFLLTMQKPFSFHKSERKSEKLKEETTSSKKHERVQGRKPTPSAVTESRLSEQFKDQEHQQKIPQNALKALVQREEASGERVTRSAEKSKGRMLGFLDQKLSFRPKINTCVPDFDKLFQKFQQKAQEMSEKRDITRCKPFQLRTSTLPPRSRSPEITQSSTETLNLRRSRSFGGLTSLSMDTLPTYITDAARKRSIAVRKSLELKDLKEQENAEWMKQHRIRSQAMSRAVVVRARAMDPHKSLKEVYLDKLKQNRQADLERMKDYQRELREMKTRVTARPYLFEQVSQRSAVNNAERHFKNTLEQAGVDESFVKSKGEKKEAVKIDSCDEDQSSAEVEPHKSTGSVEDGDTNEEQKEGNVENEEKELC